MLTTNVSQYLLTRLGYVKNPRAVQTISLEAITREIRESVDLSEKTSQARHILKTQGEEAYGKIKETLPCVLFGGKFSYAEDASLEKHSGLMVIDFDKMTPDEARNLKTQLGEDEHTVLAFISPSQCGVKWVVAVKASDRGTHIACWHNAVAYAFKQFGVEADKRGQDVSRKCFLAFDPEIVVKDPSKAVRFKPTAQTNCLILGDVGELRDVGDVGDVGELRDLPPSSLLPIELVLINNYLPTRAKGNHQDFLLNLGRHVRGIEIREAKRFKSAQIDEIVESWYKRAKPEFRPKSLQEYQDEFSNQLKAIRIPEGSTPWDSACKDALARPPRFVSELEARRVELAKLASLCFHLAKANVKWQFFLPQQKASRWLGVTQPTVGAHIQRLIRDGFMKAIPAPPFSIRKGVRPANWYEWTGPREETDGGKTNAAPSEIQPTKDIPKTELVEIEV